MAPIQWLVLSRSPLRIRSTLHRLRATPHPWKLFRQLFWPFPWYFRIPPTVSVSALQQQDQKVIETSYAELCQLCEMPIFRARDTPLRSLYRLYEDLCTENLILMGYESEYFYFRQRWRLSQIPDPKDKDSERYAILASMVEALVAAFNWRLEIGLLRDDKIVGLTAEMNYFPMEEVPEWAATVGPSPRKLILTPSEASCPPSEHFLKRNIEASIGYLHGV
ncbi:hypothetical protein FQN57_006271 [Myotisia sp. PD_48]|nr:hypothetical protein FQN57_006271 [Myotisia sp. PD_48]